MTDDDPSQVLLDALPVEAVLAAVLDQETAGVALLDRELRYVAVNDTLAAMNGLPADEHLGRTVREVLPAAADVVEPLLARVLAGERLSRLELGAGDLTGRVFRASYLPIRDGGEVAGLLAVVVDVSGGHRAEEELRRAEGRLLVALDGTATGSYEWDLAGGRVRTSDGLGEIWGRGRGWAPAGFDELLATVHPDDRRQLREQVEAVVGPEGSLFIGIFRVVHPDGTIRWLRTRANVIRGEDDRAEALVGLVADFDEERLAQIGGEFLSRASAALAESLDPHDTLRHVAELSIGEMADWCSIDVVEPDGTLQHVITAHRDPGMMAFAEQLRERYPPEPDSPNGTHEVLRTGISQLIPEITDELLVAAARDEEHLRIARELELRSALIVPIAAHGQVLGALSFFYAGPTRRYTEDALRLAEELGRRAGLALTNARLHRAEQDANTRLRQLQAVTDVTLSHLPLDELLTEMLSRIRDLLDTDFAVCLLVDPDDGHLRVHATVGLPAEARDGVPIPLGEGIAGRIALAQEAVVIDDVPSAGPLTRHLRERAKTLLGVPLRSQGRTLGVLHVASGRPRRFTEEDAELLTLVADRVGRAIDQASAYERARETAITLQRSLLPAAMPEIEGLEIAARYIPGQAGTEVGGDWYDVVDLPDGRHAICVGDVVGRGIAAAAVMGRLRSSLRAYLHVAPGPVAAMEMLDALVRSAGDVPFATVLVAVVDSATGAVELCAAGHPPPVLAADGGCRAVDLSVGRPLGAPPAPRSSTTVELPTGASLLLYTDGLVERRGTSIDERLDLLVEVVAGGPRDPQRLLDHVVASMLGDSARTDDVALVGAWRRA